jgi:Cornichon protein
MFSDLECDYINPIDLCNKLNQVRTSPLPRTYLLFACPLRIRFPVYPVLTYCFALLVCPTGKYRTRLPYPPLPPLRPMDSFRIKCTVGSVQCQQVCCIPAHLLSRIPSSCVNSILI